MRGGGREKGEGGGKKGRGGEKLARRKGGGEVGDLLSFFSPSYLVSWGSLPALLSNLLHMFRIFWGGKCVKGGHRERV
jgi:hypothetical protein